MECNHPQALRQIGSDGLIHCGICWEVINPVEKAENKAIEADKPAEVKKVTRKKKPAENA